MSRMLTHMVKIQIALPCEAFHAFAITAEHVAVELPISVLLFHMTQIFGFVVKLLLSLRMQTTIYCAVLWIFCSYAVPLFFVVLLHVCFEAVLAIPAVGSFAVAELAAVGLVCLMSLEMAVIAVVL